MKSRTHATTAGLAACIALALGAAAAMPAAAGPMDSADALVQKARPMAFGDFAARKQLCARLGVDGNCMDEALTLKDDLLQPMSDPPALQDVVPVADPVTDTPPATVQPTVTAVPEPSVLALLTTALGLLMLGRTRRQRE